MILDGPYDNRSFLGHVFPERLAKEPMNVTDHIRPLLTHVARLVNDLWFQSQRSDAILQRPQQWFDRRFDRPLKPRLRVLFERLHDETHSLLASLGFVRTQAPPDDFLADVSDAIGIGLD